MDRDSTTEKRVVADHVHDVFVEPVEQHFYKVFQEMQRLYGCTYFSYHQSDADEKNFLTFSTNPDWADIYVAEGMIDNCALFRDGQNITNAFKGENVLYVWDSAVDHNRKEKSVSDSRKDHGIFHGFSISVKEGDSLKLFGVATEESNKNFVRNIVNDLSRFKKYVAYTRYLSRRAVSQK